MKRASQNIPGISQELSTHIDNMLKYDSLPNQKEFPQGIDSIEHLTKLGLIDNDEQFVEPSKLKGELKIAAQWLKDNI